MARIFYTEQDIQDLARRGVTEVEVNDNVYLTDAAREKMEKLGIRAKQTHAPKSSAPAAAASASGTLAPQEREQVIEKVRAGVIARLGPGVDTAMVDQIVRRVVNQL
jgi:hypothetical protein